MKGKYMILTESIRLLAKQAVFVISAHTVLIMISTYAHEKIDLFFSLVPNMPAFLFFCFAPLIIVFLLSTKFARQAAVALLGILAGILVYNITTRFTVLPVIPHQETSLIWKIIYEGSFGLLLVSEAIAIWLTFKLLREIHKQINSPTKDTPIP